MALEISIERYAVELAKEYGFEAKKRGRDGEPDREVFVGEGWHFWMELKNATGTLTKAQRIVLPRLVAMGDRVYMPRSRSQVRAIYEVERAALLVSAGSLDPEARRVAASCRFRSDGVW